VPVGRDVVLFMTDQQRADQVGYASGGYYETPVLDALADRGVRFDSAYSSSTTCIPARIGLLTGVQWNRLPGWKHWPALRPGIWTVAHAFRAAGYETALIGKMHFTPAHADHGFDVMRLAEHVGASVLAPGPDGELDVDDYHQEMIDRGLARWGKLEEGAVATIVPQPPESVGEDVPFPFDLELHATSWIEREVNRFLDTRDRSRPLFLVVSFLHPHAPVNPLGPYASMYDRADTVLPGDDPAMNDTLPEPFREAFVVNGKRKFEPWRVDVQGEDTLRDMLTGIRALVRQIDDTLGRLLPRFDLDETLVAFTSDHGDYAGHRGMGMKMPWMPFEDLVRVPLVVAGAGVAGRRRVASPVQTSDLACTFCDLAGIEVDSGDFDSRSLRPYLEGSDAPEEPSVFAALGWPGARVGDWKVIVHGLTLTPVLFNLAEDPGERVNVADDPQNHDVLEAALDVVRTALARPKLEDFWPEYEPARPA
jgi:choline-sulfatase